MMVDIDHFKDVNDNYGHSTGDVVLKSVGAILREVIGDSGAVCRYGGEEFIVLIQHLEFERCYEMAEKVRTTIHSRVIGGLNVSVSIGISSRIFLAMDAQHMLDQADECLYAAKRNGRNRTIRFDRLKTLEPSLSAAH